VPGGKGKIRKFLRRNLLYADGSSVKYYWRCREAKGKGQQPRYGGTS
jgi:hypothetical protein